MNIHCKSEQISYQLIGRVVGPVIFVLMLAGEDLQNTMPPEAWRVAAVGLWMAVWWATEAIPVFATALIPIVAFAPLDIVPIREATAPYANPVIFLFFGGFLIGYLLYDYIHFYTHFVTPKSRIGKGLRKRHLQHHFAGDDIWYGVSSPFWDYVFRTHVPKGVKPTEL